MEHIFFGIQSKKHVSDNMGRWVEIAGEPIAFAERENQAKNYRQKLLGKYDVLSIDQALARYPDADVWVTHGTIQHITRYLSPKLPLQRIKFLEGNLEYRKGCHSLGYLINYGKTSFGPCTKHGRPNFETSGSIGERFSQWGQDITQLIEDIKEKNPTKCAKCPLLKYGYWPRTVQLRTIAFTSANAGDVCNFKCSYCSANKGLTKLRTEKDGFSTYEIMQQLSEIPEFDRPDVTIRLANGEFLANKHTNEMIAILLKSQWKIVLTSNLSIYRENLIPLLNTGRITQIVTSLDSGTPETFKKIKRNNMFHRVVQNLKAYPIHKTSMVLKYIFLDGVNDNEADVDGFYDIAKENGCIIWLSGNLSAPFTPRMKILTLRIIHKAKSDGIKVMATPNFIHPKDKRFIERHYKSLDITTPLPTIQALPKTLDEQIAEHFEGVSPTDATLLRFLLDRRSYDPLIFLFNVKERADCGTRIRQILSKYPLLENLSIDLTALFTDALCAVMEDDYARALESFIEVVETAELAEKSVGECIELGINIAASAENEAHYIHFSKVRIAHLIDTDRPIEAEKELAEFEQLLPEDEDLKVLRQKMQT